MTNNRDPREIIADWDSNHSAAYPDYSIASQLATALRSTLEESTRLRDAVKYGNDMGMKLLKERDSLKARCSELEESLKNIAEGRAKGVGFCVALAGLALRESGTEKGDGE